MGGVGLAEYRLEDLARLSGVSPRNIRAYRERGLLDPPRRVGRSAYYGEPHLAQLNAISQLLGKGYNSAHIAEFFDSLRRGQDLADILGIERTELGTQTVTLEMDPAGDDARALVDCGLAEVSDGSVVLTDPALGDLIEHASDRRSYVRTMVQVAKSTVAAVNGLADLTATALTQGATPPGSRELAKTVVADSLDRALKQRLAAAE